MSLPTSEIVWPKTLLVAFIGMVIGASLLCLLQLFANVRDSLFLASILWVACVVFPIFAVAGRTLTNSPYWRVLLVNLLTSVSGAALIFAGETIPRMVKGEAIAWDLNLEAKLVAFTVIPLIVSRSLWAEMDSSWRELRKLW